MVDRIRRAADRLNRYEIAARLAQAISEAADAAHVRALEQAQFGEAGADAIVDSEYYDDLAAAWLLVAGAHQLIRLEEGLVWQECGVAVKGWVSPVSSKKKKQTKAKTNLS